MNGVIIHDVNGNLLEIAWPREDGGANLRGADLSGANLRGTGVFVLGQCRRGYVFLLRTDNDKPRIQAGCRNLTLTEAREHWSSAHADDPMLRAHCLAMVATAEAIMAAAQQPASDGGEGAA